MTADFLDELLDPEKSFHSLSNRYVKRANHKYGLNVRLRHAPYVTAHSNGWKAVEIWMNALSHNDKREAFEFFIDFLINECRRHDVFTNGLGPTNIVEGKRKDIRLVTFEYPEVLLPILVLSESLIDLMALNGNEILPDPFANKTVFELKRFCLNARRDANYMFQNWRVEAGYWVP